MATTPRYRPVTLGQFKVITEPHPDGGLYVSCDQTLGEYPPRLSDRLLHWAEHTPEHSYIAQRDETGQWRHISYQQALASARSLGQALLDRKLSPERPLLILSGNEIEHALLALAAQYVGIPFASISPAYSTVSTDFSKLQHVIDLLTPGMVYASDGDLYKEPINATVPADVEVVTRFGQALGKNHCFYDELTQTTASAEVEKARLASNPDTIAKFMFTSGSTSLPKAVITTQRMLCSNLQMIGQAWPFLAEEPPVFLDWLPWNHVFGGNHNLGIILYFGGTLYIDDGRPTDAGMATTLSNLREISPTVYFNVPVGWEKVADALEQDEVLRQRYYKRIKMQFYSGAALTQPVWDKLHATAEQACGERILMTTGLGMTETSPSALFVLSADAQAGQIGVPLPGMKMRLVPNDDKLEIRYKGPNVTPGYWRSPELGDDTFDEEGFFCSGDAVKWLDPADPNKGLVFDGRVAEDFKLNTGTWVNVGPLRAFIIQHGNPYLQDAVITGHDRQALGMLIVPNIAACHKLSGLEKNASREAILTSPNVTAFFQKLVNTLFKESTGSSNRITRALILIEPPSLDLDEITDKGSINQRAVLRHRAALVEALYQDDTKGLLLPKPE